MAELHTQDQEELIHHIQRLLQHKSFMLSTVDDQGEPYISYAPFVQLDGIFYLYITRLAAHTRHLTQHPKAMIMLIDDEQTSQNIFARARLTYDVQAQVIPMDHPQYSMILTSLEARCGKTVSLLRRLNDFVLMALKPSQGLLVTGFGQAYRFDPADERFEHLRYS